MNQIKSDYEQPSSPRPASRRGSSSRLTAFFEAPIEEVSSPPPDATRAVTRQPSKKRWSVSLPLVSENEAASSSIAPSEKHRNSSFASRRHSTSSLHLEQNLRKEMDLGDLIVDWPDNCEMHHSKDDYKNLNEKVENPRPASRRGSLSRLAAFFETPIEDYSSLPPDATSEQPASRRGSLSRLAAFFEAPIEEASLSPPDATTEQPFNRTKRWSITLPLVNGDKMTTNSGISNEVQNNKVSSNGRRHSTSSLFFEHNLCKEMDVGNLVVDRPRLRRRSFKRRFAMDLTLSSLDDLTHSIQSVPSLQYSIISTASHSSHDDMSRLERIDSRSKIHAGTREKESNSSKLNATWHCTTPSNTNIGDKEMKMQRRHSCATSSNINTGDRHIKMQRRHSCANPSNITTGDKQIKIQKRQNCDIPSYIHIDTSDDQRPSTSEHECLYDGKERRPSKLLRRFSNGTENLANFIKDMLQGVDDDDESEEKSQEECETIKRDILLAELTNVKIARGENILNFVREINDDE